jgi:hypothetical protein
MQIAQHSLINYVNKKHQNADLWSCAFFLFQKILVMQHFGHHIKNYLMHSKSILAKVLPLGYWGKKGNPAIFGPIR